MKTWTLHDNATPAEKATFGNLDKVLTLQGDFVSQGPQSEVVRVTLEGKRYYIKCYRASKGLRRYFGHPRVQTEWQNLIRFETWGIPTTPLVAWGMERDGGRFTRGALVTAELPGAQDMASLARQGDPRLQERNWIASISKKLAHAMRILHQHQFAHNDLHWRNLLVDRQQQLFIFDCPSGRFWWGPFLQYRIAKDFACLDRFAKRQFTRTQRLRFYLEYVERRRLQPQDKQRIRKILAFFKGRRQWNG